MSNATNDFGFTAPKNRDLSKLFQKHGVKPMDSYPMKDDRTLYNVTVDTAREEAFLLELHETPGVEEIRLLQPNGREVVPAFLKRKFG